MVHLAPTVYHGLVQVVHVEPRATGAGNRDVDRKPWAGEGQAGRDQTRPAGVRSGLRLIPVGHPHPAGPVPRALRPGPAGGWRAGGTEPRGRPSSRGRTTRGDGAAGGSAAPDGPRGAVGRDGTPAGIATVPSDHGCLHFLLPPILVSGFRRGAPPLRRRRPGRPISPVCSYAEPSETLPTGFLTRLQRKSAGRAAIRDALSNNGVLMPGIAMRSAVISCRR